MFSGAPALTLDGAPEPNNQNWGIPGLVMTNVAIEHGHLVHWFTQLETGDFP